MERSKHHDTHVSTLHQELGIRCHLLQLATEHVERGDDVLSLSFTFVQLRLRKHIRDELLALAGLLLVQRTFLIKLLLFN